MQKLADIDTKWRVLVIIGIISLILVVGLVIFIILIFKTDLISLEYLLSTQTNTDEFDDFIADLGSEPVLEPRCEPVSESGSELESDFNWDIRISERSIRPGNDLFSEISINNLINNVFKS